MKKQKNTMMTFGLLLISLISAQAQSNNTKDYKVQGYAFAAPVVTNGGGNGAQVGAGVEGLVYQGLGAGAELSYLSTVTGFRSGLGVFSPNVSYHFLNATKSGKVVPFVTGGYTLFFRNGTASGFNYGGGVNYWFKERVGLRFEVRDQVFVNNGTGHFVGFRAGISFR